MRFNIVCDLQSDNPRPEDLQRYNEMVGYHLRRELRRRGHEAVFVYTRDLKPGKANHTIVTSAAAIQQLRTVPGYFRALRASTVGRLCLWLDSDFNSWYSNLFDRVLVVCRQRQERPDLYRWVGWAADPEVFRPLQKEPAVFVDTYMNGFYGGKLDHVYSLIESVVEKQPIEVFQPVKHYNNGRVRWPAIADLFCRSSFYVLTQPAFWGWTNIEAATAGVLLLVHKGLVLPKTWPTPLRHCVYESEQELFDLLHGSVDFGANRSVALENTWEKVVGRVLEAVA